MNEADAPSGIRRPDCPECGGRLGEPVSGSVHCYQKCEQCGEEFQLDDPKLLGTGPKD